MIVFEYIETHVWSFRVSLVNHSCTDSSQFLSSLPGFYVEGIVLPG